MIEDEEKVTSILKRYDPSKKSYRVEKRMIDYVLTNCEKSKFDYFLGLKSTRPRCEQVGPQLAFFQEIIRKLKEKKWGPEFRKEAVNVLKSYIFGYHW